MFPTTERERESMLELAPGGDRRLRAADTNASLILRREVAQKFEKGETILKLRSPKMGLLLPRSGFRKPDVSVASTFGSRRSEDRWATGKKAAKALEKMLVEPPPFRDVIDAERIRELHVMCTSPNTYEWLRGKNGLMLHSNIWNSAMGLVIMLNSVAIGLEQSLQHNNQDVTVFAILENFFLCIFIVELAMNLVEEGFSGLLHDRWLQLDTFLVGIGIFTGWILTPIMGSLDGLGPLIVLRMVRLLRLARMVRLLHQFRQLWTLVQGFLSSVGTMVYTSALLFMVIYVFSCVGMELITKNPAYGNSQAFTQVVDEHFNDLPRIMLTLVRFIAMDSVAAIYTPLITESPLLGVYFFAIVLAVFIVMMNIVTAVIVNTALETNAMDKEAKRAYQGQIRRSITQELARMFDFFDEDHQGTLSLKELKQAPPEALALLCKLTERPYVEDIFVEIDINGDGELTVEEFCQGILDIVSSEVPTEMRQMHTQMQVEFSKMLYHFERLQSKVEKGFAHMFAMEQKISLHPTDAICSEEEDASPSRRTTQKITHNRPRLQASRKHPRYHRGLKAHESGQRGSTITRASIERSDETEPAWAMKLLNLLCEVKAGVESARMCSSKQLDRQCALLQKMCNQYQVSAMHSVTVDTGSAPTTLGRAARPPEMHDLSPRADFPDSELDPAPQTPELAPQISEKKKTKIVRKARTTATTARVQAASSINPSDVNTTSIMSKSSTAHSRELEPKCVGRPSQATAGAFSIRFSTDGLLEEDHSLVDQG